MKRFIGSAAYPAEHIFENPRHTAGAMSFFLYYDGYKHECVQGALSYLLDERNRTPAGLWVDQGSLSDSRVDPLTVANIIESLENVYSQLPDREAFNSEQDKERINDAIQTGIKHLFNTKFRTEQGLWIYRYESQQEYERVLENTYRYTAGILSNIANSCERLKIRTSEINALLQELIEVTERYNGSLPPSPSSNTPSISATVNLIKAAEHYPDLRDQAQANIDRVIALCIDKRVLEQVMASGWSALALLARSSERVNTNIQDYIDRLDALAAEVLEGDPNSVGIPRELIMHESFVRQLLRIRQFRAT